MDSDEVLFKLCYPQLKEMLKDADLKEALVAITVRVILTPKNML